MKSILGGAARILASEGLAAAECLLLLTAHRQQPLQYSPSALDLFTDNALLNVFLFSLEMAGRCWAKVHPPAVSHTELRQAGAGAGERLWSHPYTVLASLPVSDGTARRRSRLCHASTGPHSGFASAVRAHWGHGRCCPVQSCVTCLAVSQKTVAPVPGAPGLHTCTQQRQASSKDAAATAEWPACV